MIEEKNLHLAFESIDNNGNFGLVFDDSILGCTFLRALDKGLSSPGEVSDPYV